MDPRVYCESIEYILMLQYDHTVRGQKLPLFPDKLVIMNTTHTEYVSKQTQKSEIGCVDISQTEYPI